MVLRWFEQQSDGVTMGRGPSAEMRRFSAGIRVVTALMCTVLLLAGEQQTVPWPKLILVAYCAWSAWLLWVEATERSSRVNGVWPYWIDVAWSCLVLKVFSAGTAMMTVTLIHPVVLTSIGFGVTPGVTLALAAALGLLYAESTELTQLLTAGWRHTLPTLLVLTLVPAAAVVARPMSVLRHRLALIDELGAQLDPRRGLESICAELVEKLRIGTQADVVALVLPSKFGAPAMLASREDGSFRAKAEVHTNLEQRLAQVPSFPVSYVARHWWDPRRRVRSHGKQPLPRGLTAALAELARTLDVRSLHVVPLQRYTREHGHFVVGYGGVRSALQDVSALSGATAELLRIVEQAALVDQLQDESASHERARIGRDLHDSAIQPYLGLKYAVECVALRIPPDNPARAEVESLATLVNSEVSALRELISGLRTGCQQGDNALVPAVRRQARRFALLFGIEVEVECADHLPTTRALASALFHMVNEALNNVRKHTAAQHVRIGLAIDGARLRLVVRDDAGTVRGRPVNDFCPGSLSERAAELGGTLTVARHDGVNTELVIEVPL